MIRRGSWTGPTPGLAPGFVQTNLVVLPQAQAYDFLLFCQRNPRPCPLLGITDPGSPEPRELAPGADLRTDLPRYRIYREGRVDGEVTGITAEWRSDLVAFLIGCSFTFERALVEAGIPLRHIEEGKNVAMWATTVECRPAGLFHGPLVVSMRPIPGHLVPRAVTVTARYPMAHGAPIQIGNPDALGIHDLTRPDWGDAVEIKTGETPVFWACGVTPQAVALAAKLPFVITHAPGHMFITDLPDHTLAIL